MKKLLTITVIGLILLVCQTACTSQKNNNTTSIQTEIPVRPTGQEDVILLTAPPIDTVRVGFIGLGMRGPGAVERWTHIP